jgi:hypothetical protein
MVLDTFANDCAAVEIGGVLSGDCGALRFAESNYFRDAAGCIVGDY